MRLKVSTITKITLLICVFLAVNTALEIEYNYSKTYDIAYLNKHCPRVADMNISDITANIMYDGVIGTAVYIFEQIPGQATHGDFIAARRSSFSSFSCIPSLGCIIPPEITSECRIGS